MRIFFLILVIVLFSCTNGTSGSKNTVVVGNDRCFTYPSIIDSLQIQDMYDSARWYIYTWECDKGYLSKKDTLNNKSFGEIPLRFKDLSFTGDTIHLNFDFTDGQDAILPSMTKDIKQLCSSVGFSMKSRIKLYMLSSSGFSIVEHSGPNRFENPLQPEVLVYIKSNWDKLDPCFRALAAQKGLRK
jgi:hypothetical protein